MEELKSLEEIASPDTRSKAYAVFKLDGGVRNVGIADRHEAISSLQLPRDVPEEVGSYFNTSCNLFLYGWFVYAFYAVAELHAYTATELALRIRARRECAQVALRFRNLLEYAVCHKWIRDEGFSIAQMREEQHIRMPKEWGQPPQRVETKRYCDILSQNLPQVRNLLAHPDYQYITLPGYAFRALMIASELITQLFPPDRAEHFPTAARQ